MIYALIVLCVVVLAQSFFLNKLINKLMSRNFYDYEITKQVTAKKAKNSDTIKEVSVDESYQSNADYLGARV